MDKASGMKSGNGPSCSKTPPNSAAAAGAAKVRATTPSGNTGSTGARPLKSGNKG